MLKELLISEKGQGMVEYGLILALVAIAAIVALTTLGQKINNMFKKVNNTFDLTDSVEEVQESPSPYIGSHSG